MVIICMWWEVDMLQQQHQERKELQMDAYRFWEVLAESYSAVYMHHAVVLSSFSVPSLEAGEVEEDGG